MSRKLWLGSFAALGLGWAVAAPVAVAAEPIAFVVALHGRVDVTPSGGKRAELATLGRPLSSGDRVQVGSDGGATLFFNNGNVVELAAGSSIVIGAKDTAKPSRATGVPGEVFASVSKSVAGGSHESGLVALAPMRGVEDHSVAMALAPRRTEVLGDRPRFEWRSVPGASRYRLSVSGDEGELWQHEVPDTSVAYPKDAPPLPRDVELLWEVVALSDHGPVRKESTFFRIVPAEDEEQVRAYIDRIQSSVGEVRPEAALYLAGSYLASQGIYRDAIEHFAALMALDPEAAGPHEALGNVYRAVGLMDLAAAEYQRALALKGQAPAR